MKRLADDSTACAQSKLALTLLSRSMGLALEDGGPAIIAVNPVSLLGSKMEKDAFGVAGKDIDLGPKIPTRAALSEEFLHASAQYYDNESGQLAAPHVDALDSQKTPGILGVIEVVLSDPCRSAKTLPGLGLRTRENSCRLKGACKIYNRHRLKSIIFAFSPA